MAAPKSSAKRKEWNTDHMAEAIKMVREKKMGYLKAAKHFDVPRTTLFRLCQQNELPPEEAAATTLGRKTVLDSSDDDEMILFDTDSEPEGLEKRTAPDTEDAECMFCHMLFSNDTQGETWIKCLMCGLWAHNDCAGAEFETWICDFCK
ncbi:hypothetical protein ACJJTC_018357 [Scirpophaga incertulas]